MTEPKSLPPSLTVGITMMVLAVVAGAIGAITQAPIWLIPPIAVVLVVGAVIAIVGLVREQA